MTQLTGNDAWRWGKAQQEAFEQLKRQLVEDVILAIPTNEGKFRVEADASEGAIGAVLSQEQNGINRKFRDRMQKLGNLDNISLLKLKYEKRKI